MMQQISTTYDTTKIYKYDAEKKIATSDITKIYHT